MFKVIHLDQPAEKFGGDITINVGWRPSMALVFNYAAAKRWAVAFDADSGPAGGLKQDSSTKASVAVGTDGISFWDKGIKIGTDTHIIDENNANIMVVLFQDPDGVTKVTLDDLDSTPGDGDTFGKGEQYGSELSGTAPNQTRTYDVKEAEAAPNRPDGGVHVTED